MNSSVASCPPPPFAEVRPVRPTIPACPGTCEPAAHVLDVLDAEGGGPLAGGREGTGDADVQLLRAAGEPDTAARRQPPQLGQLVEAQHGAEERPRVLLAPGRAQDLHVVEALD